MDRKVITEAASEALKNSFENICRRLNHTFSNPPDHSQDTAYRSGHPVERRITSYPTITQGLVDTQLENTDTVDIPNTDYVRVEHSDSPNESPSRYSVRPTLIVTTAPDPEEQFVELPGADGKVRKAQNYNATQFEEEDVQPGMMDRRPISRNGVPTRGQRIWRAMSHMDMTLQGFCRMVFALRGIDDADGPEELNNELESRQDDNDINDDSDGELEHSTIESNQHT